MSASGEKVSFALCMESHDLQSYYFKSSDSVPLEGLADIDKEVQSVMTTRSKSCLGLTPLNTSI